MPIVKIDNLSKHFTVLKRREGLRGAVADLFSRDFRTVKAVDGLSMEIAEGEMVGFVGPNGAGKSTTIKALTGVLAPSAGTVSVCGFNPFRDRRHYVKSIGVVFGQRTQLWWDLPVIESFKLLKAIYKIEPIAFCKAMGTFNDLVHLDELYSTPVRNLSLGQRMLCDIAAAFLHNPRVIFLDEPTIGLDILNKSKIRTIIKDLNATQKTTVLLTSHDMSDMEKLCNRIVLIDKGKMVFDGPIAKFNTLFGSFRTLELDLHDRESLDLSAMKTTLHSEFSRTDAMTVVEKDDGRMEITVNQDLLSVADVLSFTLREFSVKDLKLREPALESVIQKVYEGALDARVS